MGYPVLALDLSSTNTLFRSLFLCCFCTIRKTITQSQLLLHLVKVWLSNSWVPPDFPLDHSYYFFSMSSYDCQISNWTGAERFFNYSLVLWQSLSMIGADCLHSPHNLYFIHFWKFKHTAFYQTAHSYIFSLQLLNYSLELSQRAGQ